MTRPTDPHETEAPQVSNFAPLIQIAGTALAEMGVVAPSESVLEPVARVIYDLNQVRERSDYNQCRPRAITSIE